MEDEQIDELLCIPHWSTGALWAKAAVMRRASRRNHSTLYEDIHYIKLQLSRSCGIGTGTHGPQKLSGTTNTGPYEYT